MIVGNLIALRQTNIVRMLAYSGIAQAGYMLAPLAVVGSRRRPVSLQRSSSTCVIYAAMNLGAFAVGHRRRPQDPLGRDHSFGGLFQYAPGLTVAMTIFLFCLAGIPPLGGWFAKFGIFHALARRRHRRRATCWPSSSASTR